MTCASFTVVRDPLCIFRPEEDYQADDILEWLTDDEMPLNMIMRDKSYHYWIVCDSEFGPVLKRCNSKGQLVSTGEMWPEPTEPVAVDMTKTRWQILIALFHFEEAVKAPSMRDIATVIGCSVRGVEKQINNLVRLGLVTKEKGKHCSMCLTELGRKLAREYKGDL